MNDPQIEGMTLVRYIDVYPWTKDPDGIALQKREHVSDPRPADCRRIRVEITLNKKWFLADGSEPGGKVKTAKSEPHDGVVRPPADQPEPLKAQGS